MLMTCPAFFENIATLGQQSAYCWQHGQPCRVKSVDILVVGTCCKDMSRANAGSSRGNFVLAQATSRGGFAQTFQGLLSYVEERRPLLILFENVDGRQIRRP